MTGGPSGHPTGAFEQIWLRIQMHAGQEFKTKTGKSFIYAADTRAVYPPTNRVLGRSQFEKAWERRPLTTTSQLHDLQGPSYLYAILTDSRITG